MDFSVFTKGCCDSGEEPASCYRKVAGSIPLVCMWKCPNCPWCAGRHLAWQPPPSVCECRNYCESLWTKASDKCWCRWQSCSKTTEVLYLWTLKKNFPHEGYNVWYSFIQLHDHLRVCGLLLNSGVINSALTSKVRQSTINITSSAAENTFELRYSPSSRCCSAGF